MLSVAGPKAAIFDLDGTLVDSFDLVVLSFATACRDFLGRELSREEVISRFGVTEVQMLRRELPVAQQEKAIAVFRETYARNHARLVKVFAGIPELLDALRERRIPMGVMTAKGRDTADVTLRELGWTEVFGSVVTGDDVERTKPFPDGVLRVAKELGVAAEDCIFVGDAPADIGAGEAAGMKTVWAGWHPVYEKEVRKLAPDVITASPAEVLRLFEPSS